MYVRNKHCMTGLTFFSSSSRRLCIALPSSSDLASDVRSSILACLHMWVIQGGHHKRAVGWWWHWVRHIGALGLSSTPPSLTSPSNFTLQIIHHWCANVNVNMSEANENTNNSNYSDWISRELNYCTVFQCMTIVTTYIFFVSLHWFTFSNECLK